LNHGVLGNDKKVAADNASTGADTGLVREAAADLYAGDPAEFIQRRGDLAAQARASGQGEAAKAIASLRKPTRAAWVVNRLVHTDPDVPSRLTALGDDLRDAGRSLDGRRLRELSQARRDLIAALTRQALAGAGQRDAPEALREEVTATLSAAVADPEVAAELAEGILVRPVERSGFGFDPSGQDAGAPVPDLRPPARKQRGPGRAGRQGAERERAEPAGRPEPAGKNQAERRRAERERAERERAERARAEQEQAEREHREAIAAAERTIDEAGQAAEAAQSAERTYEEAVRDLEQQLDDAHDRLAGAKRTSRAAAAALRDARRALDRLRRRGPA
jgi:hypothetical protein